MRKITFLTITFCIFLPVNAQVQIKPLPKPGYEKRIMDFVNQLRVIDTHEHILSFGQLRDNSTPDFVQLLVHYPFSDLSAAGMPDQDLKKLLSKTITAPEKWKVLQPYWEATSNTAYCRSALLAADRLFGVKNIDSSTIVPLSEKIKKAYQDPAAWYYQVLHEKCGIDQVLIDVWSYRWDSRYDNSYDPRIFKFVKRFDDFIFINSKGDIENFIRWKNKKVTTLDEFVAFLGTEFHASIEQGMVAVKSGLAYDRILSYDNVSKEKAEAIFNKIMNSTGETNLSFEEVKPLQDYMMHRVLDQARDNHIPVQIHTGLLNHEKYIIENSKPTLLVNLFQEYPDVNFILFHGSYPYGGELSTLAKNFRNVYIDMCWLYLISPSYSERYLHEWLETVPANKIMGFGGDFWNVEGVYAHLLMAKQIISNVLIAKVRDGYFTEEEALKIAQMILHNNAVRILNLK